ncbi:unnamed protein product, partial [Allacma fusca]
EHKVANMDTNDQTSLEKFNQSVAILASRIDGLSTSVDSIIHNTPHQQVLRNPGLPTTTPSY